MPTIKAIDVSFFPTIHQAKTMCHFFKRTHPLSQTRDVVEPSSAYSSSAQWHKGKARAHRSQDRNG